MKKYIFLLLLIQACAYKPVIDHRGSNGKDVAYRFNDDLETCKAIAKQQTNSLVEAYKVIHNYYIRPSLLWLPDKQEFTNKAIVKKCLENRGHSVLQ